MVVPYYKNTVHSWIRTTQYFYVPWVGSTFLTNIGAMILLLPALGMYSYSRLSGRAWKQNLPVIRQACSRPSSEKRGKVFVFGLFMFSLYFVDRAEGSAILVTYKQVRLAVIIVYCRVRW